MPPRLLPIVLAAACTSTHPVQVTVHDAERSEMAGAGLLMNGFNEAGMCHAMWLTGDGETLFDIDCEPGHRFFRMKPSSDGRDILLASNRDGDGLVPDGFILRIPLDGGIPMRTEAPLIHHDFVELAEGFAYLSYVEDQRLIQGQRANLATDTVVEVSEGGSDHRVVFDFLTDYPVAPYWSCSHMRGHGWLPDHNEWTHTNSLVPHPTDDAWLLMPRYLDAVIKVDRATSTVDWQLGGRHDFFDLSLDDALSHPHMSHAPSSDTVLVFDNRLHSREDSRVVEWAMDRDAGTAEIVWSYTHPEIGNVGFLGDARRLPGGNTLIAWTDERRLTEVTPEGDIVWELLVDNIKYVGRVELWEGALP